MAEQAKKNLNIKHTPENEKLNVRKTAPGPLNSRLDAVENNTEEVTAGRSYEEHIRLLACVQSPEQLTAMTAQLQRTYGNSYVQKLFKSPALQAGLKAKTTGFSYSGNTAKTAASSFKAAKPQQQEEEEEEQLQATGESKSLLLTSESVEARIKKALGSGKPLPRSLQATLEPRFGEKVSRIRIHTGIEANQLARALKAASFSTGCDIFFRRGMYKPDTAAGRRLIVREISHITQAEHASRTAQRDHISGIHTSIPLSITPMTMLDAGKTGKATLWQAEKVTPAPISTETLRKSAPRVFVNGGKTGSAQVWWGGGGGGGGQGNQFVGDVTEVLPRIQTSLSGILGLYGQPKAWVAAGTGTATVTRSYVGVNVGANGTYYITARAAAQIDRHEEDHVNASRRHHDTYIVPLEARVAQRTGEPNALPAGANRNEARAFLEAFIDWTSAINNFRTHDTTDNIPPNGTVDMADKADPNTKKDFGPRTVDGVHYDHYVDIEPGPPAEAPAAEATGEETH